MDRKMPLGVEIIAWGDLLFGLFVFISGVWSKDASPILFKIILGVLFATPLIAVSFLTFQGKPSGRPWNIYIASLVLLLNNINPLGEIIFSGENLQVLLHPNLLYSFYSVWVLWYLTRAHVRSFFTKDDTQKDRGTIKAGYLKVIIVLGLVSLINSYATSAYRKVMGRLDGIYIKNIKEGKLDFKGLEKISIKDGELLIKVDSREFARAADFGFTEVIATSHLVFKKEENISGYVKPQYAFQDTQAEKAAFIYTYAEYHDKASSLSNYKENLFLDTFDGKEAKFIVLIAKREKVGEPYKLYIKKELTVNEETPYRPYR